MGEISEGGKSSETVWYFDLGDWLHEYIYPCQDSSCHILRCVYFIVIFLSHSVNIDTVTTSGKNGKENVSLLSNNGRFPQSLFNTHSLWKAQV